MIIKTCTKCNKTYEGETIDILSTWFPYQNKSQGKLQPACKECNRKRTREFKNKHKERYNEISKEWRKNNSSYSSDYFKKKTEIGKIYSKDVLSMPTEELYEFEQILTDKLLEIKKEIEKRK